MTNDVAVFLDLDNLVIGAKQANLTFNVNFILDHIKEITKGRIVLRRSYGDWRQSRDQMKDLATAGFNTQSTVQINSFGKNLADMQIVVDAMDTLIDGHQYETYVLMTGDRDFTPLVQALRKRGKQVIGVGVRHTASGSFVALCDRYLFYEDLMPAPALTEANVEELLVQALTDLERSHNPIRASILKQHMDDLSQGAFSTSSFAESSFSKFLARYPHLLKLEQEDTTTYVRRRSWEQPPDNEERALHLRYRSALKKRKLRVVAPKERLTILKDLIQLLLQDKTWQWRSLINTLDKQYSDAGQEQMSKNLINAVLLLARRAEIIETHKSKSLSTALVSLQTKSSKPLQEAILRCDRAYVEELLLLPEDVDAREMALALYDSDTAVPYLQKLIDQARTSG